MVTILRSYEKTNLKKGSIDNDVLYDDDDCHKDNDHDNHAHCGDNDNFIINIITIIPNDDDNDDGVVYDDGDDH